MKMPMKVVSIIISLILVCAVSVSAHSSSQAGILEQEYIEEYGRSCIGGEDIGWSVDEAFHIGTTTFFYRFINVPSNLQDKVREAAALWSNTVTITELANATGEFSCFNDPEDNNAAVFAPIRKDTVTGHLTQWLIGMNLACSITTETIAHEFGHVIGLNDLYADHNIDKLMYYHISSTAMMPTDSDIWGAKVILGIHTTHSFNEFRYWGTDSSGVHYHVQYCSDCNGNRATKSRCTVSTSNLTQCLKCGFSLNQA